MSLDLSLVQVELQVAESEAKRSSRCIIVVEYSTFKDYRFMRFAVAIYRILGEDFGPMASCSSSVIFSQSSTRHLFRVSGTTLINIYMHCEKFCSFSKLIEGRRSTVILLNCRLYICSWAAYERHSFVCLFNCLWLSLSRSYVHREVLFFRTAHERSLTVHEQLPYKTWVSKLFYILQIFQRHHSEHLNAIPAMSLKPAVYDGNVRRYWRC